MLRNIIFDELMHEIATKGSDREIAIRAAHRAEKEGVFKLLEET